MLISQLKKMPRHNFLVKVTGTVTGLVFYADQRGEGTHMRSAAQRFPSYIQAREVAAEIQMAVGLQKAKAEVEVA